MTVTPAGKSSCGFCHCEITDPVTPCPQCGAGPLWRDWAAGMSFLRDRLVRYTTTRMLRSEQVKEITAYYNQVLKLAKNELATGRQEGFSDTKLPSRLKCWHCSAAVSFEGDYCPRCGSNVDSSEAARVRYLEFLARKAQDLHAGGLLDLNQAHAIETDVRNERQAICAKLESQRVSGIDLQLIRKRNRPGEPASTSPQTPPIAPTPISRRNLLEILLDPQSIQWMLACGGVLLVVGIVIYLASRGLFENPRIVAGLMGIGSVAVLAAGCWVLKKTRFHLAGRAITLLACLAMPLNLWFYHAQGLMTLEGHLWFPAMVICLLYAATAVVLRDPLFVYVTLSGVTMTAMLILVDLHRFVEIATPATVLMVLGLLCMHVERAFPVTADDNAFSRKRFGMAFFWSAQGLIVASLGLVLGTQIVGRLWWPIFSTMLLERPLLATDHTMKLLALGLVACGAYSAIWSSVVVRRKVIYTHIAAALVLWAELLGIDLIGRQLGAEMIIVLLSGTALAAILASKLLGAENALVHPLRPLGLFLGFASVAIGVLLHLRATNAGLHHDWPFNISSAFILAMLTSALVNRIGAWANQTRQDRYAQGFFFLSAGALLVAIAGALSISGLASWDRQAIVLILLPIVYLAVSRWYGQSAAADSTATAAEWAAGVMALSVLFSALHITPQVIEPVTGKKLNLLLAAFCVEAAVFYALLSLWRTRTYSIYAATALLCGALWQVFGYFNLPSSAFVNAFGLVGLMLLVIYRLALLDESGRRRLAVACFQSGNGLMLVSFIASVLMTLADLMGSRIGSQQLLLTSSLSLMLLLASVLVRASSWRRWHVIAAIGSGAMAAICLQQMSRLSGWQTMELFLVAVGLLMLAVGHTSWYREQSRAHSDMVSFCLRMGALMVCIPLGIAMFYSRFFTPQLSLMDELGLLTAAILLFLTGMMFKLKDTTLIGGLFLAVHLIVLIVSAGMRTQLAVGVYLTLGGATLFSIGLLCNLNRERLLALPDRVRQRQGVFRVLSWR